MGNSPRLLAVKRAARATKQARRFHPSSSSHPIHQFIAFFFVLKISFAAAAKLAPSIARTKATTGRRTRHIVIRPRALQKKKKLTSKQQTEARARGLLGLSFSAGHGGVDATTRVRFWHPGRGVRLRYRRAMAIPRARARPRRLTFHASRPRRDTPVPGAGRARATWAPVIAAADLDLSTTAREGSCGGDSDARPPCQKPPPVVCLPSPGDANQPQPAASA